MAQDSQNFDWKFLEKLSSDEVIKLRMGVRIWDDKKHFPEKFHPGNFSKNFFQKTRKN